MIEQVKPARHYIGGKFVDGETGETFATIAPATGREITRVALGTSGDVARAVTAAEQALEASSWSKQSVAARSELLRKIGDKILERREELARLESIDSGKPLSETLNGDIPRAARNFHFFADLIKNQPCPAFFDDDGSVHQTMREPLGVVGLITPWNLPLYLATWKIAPALGQGNAVILKPAEATPLTATALAEIIDELDVPPGVFNVVHGFGPGGAGQALVAHPDVRAISFTGETSTGSAIMRDAAAGLKKLSFELGGKGASVIFADADLDEAARTSARAAFRNQGQICLAGSRLIVEESVAERVVATVVEAARALKIGDPLDPATTMGALISEEHLGKVESYLAYAREQGYTFHCGGGRPADLTTSAGYFLAPTVIGGVPQQSRLIQEEIFGPVLTVQTFKTRDEALALLNGTPYGLSCSIWSRDVATTDYMARRARMGLVWVNSWFVRNLHTAFGGMKRSGIGREGGQYSLDFYSELKTVSTKCLGEV